jgi:hypothetical protein
MLSILLFIQSNAPHIDWTGDAIRTWLQAFITGGVGVAVRLLWCMRDDVRELRRDIHGDKEGRGGLIELVDSHGEQIDWLWRKRYAQMVLENAEKELHEGPERRQQLRRERDIVNEAFNDDFPISPPKTERKKK